LSKGCNASFITIIPKLDNPIRSEDFRPISLVGNFYKIIAKNLAKRLQKIMHTIIDQKQQTFIQGRGILDSIIVANEAIEEVRKKKKKCIIVKADFEKAYDSMDWNFLLYMLQMMGFENTWIKLIRSCLRSSSISILVNGNHIDQFHPTKSLRQGDPLV